MSNSMTSVQHRRNSSIVQWMHRAAVALACGLSVQIASAIVIYDESVSGDLSNSGLLPTVLAVAPGLNEVFGTTGADAPGPDRDYFTFAIPSGFALTSIVVLPVTTTGGSVSFMGVQAGTQVTVQPAAPDATGLLGWKHYSALNGDILGDLSIPAAGSTGFSPPLGPGNYAFWVQDEDLGTFTYGFEFNVEPAGTAVPDSGPGLWGCAVALALLAGLHRLRSSEAGLRPLPAFSVCTVPGISGVSPRLR